MDISFSCIHCGQSIVIDEAGAGLSLSCPNCNAQITVPALSDQSESLRKSIEQKRKQAIESHVPLANLLAPDETALWKEIQRQQTNANARESYARNREKEIAEQIRKQRTPEGKAAKLFLNTLARARRWQDKELESALLEERAIKGKAALVDMPAIMRRLGRGHKWRIRPPPQPKPPKEKRRSKASQLTRETIFERTKGGETALHRAITNGQFEEVPKEALSLETFLAQNELGRTPLHYAAHFGCLDKIPRQYLTKQTLSVKNSGGRTPLHIAAQDGHLDQIPRELLTRDLMTIQDNSLGTPEIYDEWRKRPPMPDSDNTRWHADEISVRQKGVLLFFGKSIEGLNKGQASAIITEIFNGAGNRDCWETAKGTDLAQFGGTPVHKFIRKEAGEDWDDFDGETLDSALERINDYGLFKREEELAEIDRWLESEDSWPSREPRLQPPKIKRPRKLLRTTTQLLILVALLVLLLRACR